jgi:hypothetical protein
MSSIYKMSILIKHIEASLRKTEENDSKLIGVNQILKMEGMSGKKTRHFYNNICSMDDVRYLEIGTWKGSSLCSAMYKNKMTCVAVDNWSEFWGPKAEFMSNFNKFKGENNATFIEKNCWDIDARTIGKFNIYMYDGAHTEVTHFRALSHYLPCLDDEFIYIVDDWNWEYVRNGTLDSIKKNNLRILYHKWILTPSCHPSNDWHNGISIFVLRKQ